MNDAFRTIIKKKYQENLIWKIFFLMFRKLVVAIVEKALATTIEVSFIVMKALATIIETSFIIMKAFASVNASSSSSTSPMSAITRAALPLAIASILTNIETTVDKSLSRS